MAKSLPREKEIRPVRVEWVDSMGTAGWRDYSPADLRCTSVGILVDQNDERVVIANSVAHANQGTGYYHDVLEIPRAAVKRIRRLK